MTTEYLVHFQNDFAEAELTFIEGGATRAHSVENALCAIGEDFDYIAVHDAVRPLTTPELVYQCLEKAQIYGAVVPGIFPSDTVKWLDLRRMTVNETLDRRRVLLVQTPQIFQAEVLRLAYREARGRGDFGTVTDDATLVEAVGVPVSVVPGERSNLKITYPEDLAFAEFWLAFLTE
jgi:2-C-methyl-D-erythritol 4-phosphate cytidylyltransferase